MRACRVLVVSPNRTVADLLTAALPATSYVIRRVTPGAPLPGMAVEATPDVVVLDRVHDRPEQAEAEVATLKRLNPEVRVIAISETSSVRDAGVVGQGLFYYLAGGPITAVIEVVEAAARRGHAGSALAGGTA